MLAKLILRQLHQKIYFEQFITYLVKEKENWQYHKHNVIKKKDMK